MHTLVQFASNIVHGIMNKLFDWQSLAGALIGAFAAFAVWWVSEKARKKNEYKEGVYYLERLLVDQLNSSYEAKNTLQLFIDNKLTELLQNISTNPLTAYSIDAAFFPLFPVRPISEEIHKITTKSNYVDNKIARAYKISYELAHAMDDARRQFDYTIKTSREIAINRLNPPEVQKKQYYTNVLLYKKFLHEDFLTKNFPIYTKMLAEARVPLSKLREIGIKSWNKKFNPKFKFYLRKKDYEKAKKEIYEKMDEYFTPKVKGLINEIEASFNE